MIRFITVISMLLTSFASYGQTCPERFDISNAHLGEGINDFNLLPKALLVARKANLYVEGIDGKGAVFRLHTYQDFVGSQKQNSKSRVLCNNLSKSAQQDLSLMGMTLIDLRADPSVGNSVWQFDVSLEKGVVQPLNRQSKILSEMKDPKQIFSQLGGEYRIFQTKENQIELIVYKQNSRVNKYLVVTFDIVKD